MEAIPQVFIWTTQGWKRGRISGQQSSQGKGITNGRRKLRRIVIHFYLTAIVIILYCGSYAILGQLEIIDLPTSLRYVYYIMYFILIFDLFKALYYPRLQILIQIGNLYLFLCWNLALFVYVFFTHALYFEIREFNQLIAKVNNCLFPNFIQSFLSVTRRRIRTSDWEDRECHFNPYYECEDSESTRWYIQGISHLPNNKGEVPFHLQRYAFLMLSTNLPTTLFAFFLLFSRRHHPWTEIIMILPVILFCVVGFLSLTAAPAKLHDAVSSIN